MKSLIQLGLCGLLAPGLFAQHHGGGAGMPGHRPGPAHAPVQTFGYGRYGAYGYGGFFGDYYEPSFNNGYAQPASPSPSNVTVVYPPAAPPVIVTETAHPVIHEYARPEDYGTATEHDSHPILYLIAFRDSNIRAAMTYWVEDATLHYLDAGHKERQAPLSSVDRDLSAQLNRERHIPFNLQ